MKIREFESNTEKQILIALITNRDFVSQLYRMWVDKPENIIFKHKYSKVIAGWCFKYFEKAKDAIGKNVEKRFLIWSEKQRNKELIEPIEDFLVSLSDEYTKTEITNVPYLLDICNNWFLENKIRHLVERVDTLMELGQVTEANDLLEKHQKVDLNQEESFDIFGNDSEVDWFFEKPDPCLFRMPGELGLFLGNELSRDSLLSFMGPEKSGKTKWMIEIAYQALKNRLRVAFFSVGDLSKHQMQNRIYTRICGRPLIKADEKIYDYPTSLKIVNDKDVPGKLIPAVTTKKITKQRMTKEFLKEKLEDFRFTFLRSESSFLKISVHPSDSISVRGISTILDSWELQEGWIPDIVIIDYADILAPDKSFSESRESVNHTWSRLRQLSQKRHCCILTATQSDAQSYNAVTLSKKHFSNDKRKFAHVNGMIGINRTEQEQRDQLYRLNWLVLREDEFDIMRTVATASCLGLGRMNIFSKIVRKDNANTK